MSGEEKTSNSYRTKNEARKGWRNRNPHQQQKKFLIREFYEYLWRQNIFNQKPVISRWKYSNGSRLFCKLLLFRLANEQKSDAKLMKNVSKKDFPSLLTLNAFRVLSYLFDYLQFCASLLLNISLPATLNFLGAHSNDTQAYLKIFEVRIINWKAIFLVQLYSKLLMFES